MRRRAFTLIEALVVIAILAVVVGGVVAAMGDTQGHAQRELACHELGQLRDAVLRFQADTGWLPGEGPFDLSPRPLGAVQPADVTARFGVAAADVSRWCDSATNLWQLLTSPLPASHPLAAWSPDRRRGWRGPYLGMGAEGTVQAGFVNRRYDPHSAAPSGETASDGLLAAARLPLAPAVGDPFAHPSDGAGPRQLLWSRWPPVPGQTLASEGSPYLLIIPADPAQRSQARLVCVGRDLELDSVPGEGDDQVLYLLR